MAIFLLKLTLCWGFFALIYSLLLRQETFFRSSRLYLLGTAALGILLACWPESELPAPLFSPEEPIIFLPLINIGMQTAENTAQSIPGISWLWVVYILGAALAGARTVHGLFKIYQLLKTGAWRRLEDGAILIETPAVKIPFSFFKWVFIPAPTPSDNLPMLLAHERAHARGGHSYDVLFAEILCVFLWFHPLSHWYRKALRTVHEYLADAAASSQSDKKQYGLLLIGQAQSGMQLSLVNHFFQSPLKQRIIMLTKTSSSPVRALKFALVLPLTLLFILVFRQGPLLAQQAGREAQAEFDGGQPKLFAFLVENIKYPAAAKTANAEGTVFVSFNVKKDGSISDVAAVKSAKEVHPDLTAEAIRVVKSMPPWKPAVKDGKIVKSQMTLPIKFSLDSKTLELFDLQEMPEFPGGQEKFMEFLANNIQYPSDARKNGIQGMVAVSFVIETDGSLSEFTNLRSPREDLYQEAVRVLKLAPKFKPGKKDGQEVRVKYTLPVKFKL